MNRFKIAQYIALGATACSVIGGVILEITGANIGGLLICIGVFAGLVSYIFGGLLTAIKMAGRIAKSGWMIFRFPFDIVTFVVFFMFAIFAFAFLPIIPVRKAYKENMH